MAKKTSVKKAKAVKAGAIVSHQWKLAKENGLDRSLGHGGIYNLRTGDFSRTLVVEGRAKGAAKRLVCIFKGAKGVCFLDGAFVGKSINVGGFRIETDAIKNVCFFGSVESACAFVKKNGKANNGRTNEGESFSHVFNTGGHYGIATDGKRLLRTEESNCSGNAKDYMYSFGKAKK